MPFGTVMDIISASIMALATMALALFTWRIWNISNEQHKLYHDPDLSVFPLSNPQMCTLEDASTLAYGVTLINPGRVPMVIEEIKERTQLTN